MFRYCHFALAAFPGLVLPALPSTGHAAPWETLEDCRLVPSFLNDGDSFLVTHGSREFVIRLYFVDAPEVSEVFPERVEDQAAYFGLEDKEDAVKVGRNATLFAREFLRGGFTLQTRWEDGMGQAKRYLAVIEKEGRYLSEALAENGMARIHGFRPVSAWPGGYSAKTMLDRLRVAENRAKRERTGGWGSLTVSGLDFLKKDEPMEEEETGTPDLPAAVTVDGHIDVNLASKSQLKSLPGVGDVLAQRIIDGRPWFDKTDLTMIRGIGDGLYRDIETSLRISIPDTVPETANFYKKERAKWLRRYVDISVTAIEEKGWPAPDGFAVLMARTGKDGIPGGVMPLFIPEERLERVKAFFSEPGKEARTQAVYYEYQGQDILVIPKSRR